MNTDEKRFTVPSTSSAYARQSDLIYGIYTAFDFNS